MFGDMAKPEPPPIPKPILVTVYAVEKDRMTGGWVTIRSRIPRATLAAGIVEITEPLLAPGVDIERKVRLEHA